MILTMMTRATRGHTGRSLVADPRTTAIYALVTLAAIARVAAAFAAGRRCWDPDRPGGQLSVIGRPQPVCFSCFCRKSAGKLDSPTIHRPKFLIYTQLAYHVKGALPPGLAAL